MELRDVKRSPASVLYTLHVSVLPFCLVSHRGVSAFTGSGGSGLEAPAGEFVVDTGRQEAVISKRFPFFLLVQGRHTHLTTPNENGILPRGGDLLSTAAWWA